MTQTPSRFKAAAALAVLVAMSAAAPALAQSAPPSSASRQGSVLSPRDIASRDFGRREYERSCASCHGASGKGDGVLAGLLIKNPPDLTQLTRSNQGVFPFQRLYQVIDGESLPAHGTREMPVWGREYRLEDGQYFTDSPMPYDPQALVRSRILSLLEYINRLQVR
ncbi:MAG: c-type cytochrome [Betaproteobacteria bacterium]